MNAASFFTWWASSRVGTRTSARGFGASPPASPLCMILWIAGRR